MVSGADWALHTMRIRVWTLVCVPESGVLELLYAASLRLLALLLALSDSLSRLPLHFSHLVLYITLLKLVFQAFLT